MNIIVTGASKGIGREVCLKLADDSRNKVLAIARTEKLLMELAEEAEHKNISYMATDLNEALQTPEKLLNDVKRHFESVDNLVNNAGILFNKTLDDISIPEIRLMTETHFISPLLLIKTLSKLFNRGSHVVNISSMGGFQGSSKYPGMAVYSASKAALANLTEGLASEYAKDGIAFNCLALGAVQTEMLEQAFPGYKAPVSADDMANFISWFSIAGHMFFNGKILPVSVSNP